MDVTHLIRYVEIIHTIMINIEHVRLLISHRNVISYVRDSGVPESAYSSNNDAIRVLQAMHIKMFKNPHENPLAHYRF